MKFHLLDVEGGQTSPPAQLSIFLMKFATIRIGVGIFDPFDWRARFNVKAYLDDEFLGEKEVDMRTIIEAHVEFTKELAEKPIQPPAPQVPQEKPVPYPAAMIIPSLICGALFIITSSRA